MKQTIVFVVKGYPRISETFIAQEIAGLEKLGIPVLIFSLRSPTDAEQHPIHEEIKAPIIYLPEHLHREPVRVVRAWWRQRGNPNLCKAFSAWWNNFKRDIHRHWFLQIAQAIVLVDELPKSIGHLHAHFLHTPASVTRYAAILSGLPWSCSAHAKDIWITPNWEKVEKLAEMDWLVTCTKVGCEHLAALASDEGRVELIYHGLDFSRFHPKKQFFVNRNGKDPSDPINLLSVGRAVPKKGYDVLLTALTFLPLELHWQFEHIGGGIELSALREQAAKLGLADRIVWHGAKAHDAVLSAYRQADIFVLASRIAKNGDRDGLPNVLLEAQSQRLPCVSTHVSAIPELIRDEETGLLVPQGNPCALAEALERLIIDPHFRQELGREGFTRVRKNFSHEAGIERLARKFMCSS